MNNERLQREIHFFSFSGIKCDKIDKNGGLEIS